MVWATALVAVAAAATGGCPTAQIPAALSAIGIETRNCFFGSQQAADNALRAAATEAGCVQVDTDPPVCECPSPTTPLDSSRCGHWAINLVRFYTTDPASESAFVHALATRLAAACQTSNGALIPPGAGDGIDPDALIPACQRTAPAKTADLAAFTGYIVLISTAFAFVAFEVQGSPDILGKSE